MSYSLQLYTVRGPLEDNLEATVKRVAELGYTQVEPYNFVATADALAAAMAANGLTAPSGHAPLLSQDQDKIFQAAQKLGIGTVIDPHVDSARWTTETDIKETAKSLNAAAAKGAEYGIAVGYHNHEFELENRINGRSALEVLAEYLDPQVVLEVDTYWAAVGGEDPVALLERLGDRVRFIHIKDGPLTKVDKDQVAVGSGRMPIREIIAAAKNLEAGVVELDDFNGDIFDAIGESLTYLKAGN